MAEVRISSGPHFAAARPALAGFNLFTVTVTIPHVFGQGKASGRTDNFERVAVLAAGSSSTANRGPLTPQILRLSNQNGGFHDLLSDWPSGGALPVNNDGASNMAGGWAGAFLPVPG